MAVQARELNRQLRVKSIREIETSLVLEAIYQRYGYDLRGYEPASVTNKLEWMMRQHSLSSVSDLIHQILHEEEFFDVLVQDMAISVTEMFRNPGLFRFIRNHVITWLKTFPFVNIWIAGCASGEEAYSMAIILKEEGLLARTQIYATDINTGLLEIGKTGSYAKKELDSFSDNYKKAGGIADFTRYYEGDGSNILMNADLAENITFYMHNLAVDGIFGEMHLILCKNVLVYMNKTIQRRALSLMAESLHHNGFLCLGKNEAWNSDIIKNKFYSEEKNAGIFRKRHTGA